MDANERRFVSTNFTFNKSNLLFLRSCAPQSFSCPASSPTALEFKFSDFFDRAVMNSPMSDQITNGSDLEVMSLCKCNQVIEAGHCPVLVHYFTDHPRRI